MTSISMISNMSVNITLMDNFNNKVDQLINGVQLLNEGFESVGETLKEMCGLQSQLLNKESSTTNIINQQISLTNSLQVSIQQAAQEEEKLTDNVNKGSSKFEELSGKAKNFLSSFLGMDSIKNGIQTTIAEAVKMQDQMISVQEMLGNKEAGGAYFNDLQKQANQSGFAFQDLQNNARNFLGITKNTDSLDKLTNLSERLSLGDPSKGLDGAGGAIKDMMFGNSNSLKTDFGFNDDDIGILKASKDMDDFTSKFDGLLNKKGLDGNMLDGFNNSATAQFNNLQSNLSTGLGKAGQGALEALVPIMAMINQMFSNGSFQPFFDAISIGLAGIADIIQLVSELIISGLPVIIPILAGIVTMLAIWKGSLFAVAIYQGIVNFAQGAYALITGQATLAQLGFNTAMLACPIFWIVAIILAVIIAIGALIACCEPVRMAFATAFQGIASSCSAAFGIVVDCVQNVLNWIINKLNEFLGGVNKVSTAIASIWGGTGRNLHIDNVNFSDFKNTWQGKINDMGSSGANAIQNFSIDNITASIKNVMGMNGMGNPDDILKNYNNTQNPGALSMNNMSDTLHLPFGSDNNNDLTKGVVQGSESLDNINSTIDASSEHLEMLRDLAEQESIQNFVSLTPTVQVTTGDIKQEADVNTIISHIENYMETELANSAEGLYA